MITHFLQKLSFSLSLFSFIFSPSLISFPSLFYRLWPEGLMKAATQQSKEKSDRPKKRLKAACAVCAETKGGFGRTTWLHQRRQFTGAAFLSISSARERERAKKSHKRCVCEACKFHLLPQRGEENAQRPHKLPQTAMTLQLNTVPTPLFTLPNHVRSFSPL